MPDSNPALSDHNPADNPGEIADKHLNRFVNAISARIMLATVAVIVVLVIILGLQLYWYNAELSLKAIEALNTLKGASHGIDTQNLLARAYLEHDAQELRTIRTKWLISSRLFTHGLAIMSGILMVTMGSAFIFARIQSGESHFGMSLGGEPLSQPGSPEAAASMAKEKAKLVFSSYSPGIFFAFFGTIIIVATLAAGSFSTIGTADAPVFLRNYNTTTSQQGVDGGAHSLFTTDGKYDPDKKCELLGTVNPDYCNSETAGNPVEAER